MLTPPLAGTLVVALEQAVAVPFATRQLAEIANARINSVSQFMQHPQFAARNAWREVDSPAGRVPALIPPVRIGGVDPVMGAIPEVGQHSESIAAELGFDGVTIKQWKNEHLF